MTRRRLLIAGAALVAGSAVVAVFLARKPRVSRATMELVRVGMARDEVIATVGRPPGDYSAGVLREPRGLGDTAAVTECWVCDEGELIVRYDGSGRAKHVEIWGVSPLDRGTFLQRLRDWLGL